MAATVTTQVGIGDNVSATTIETASFSPTGSNKTVYAEIGCGDSSPGSPNSVKYASAAGVGGEVMTLVDSVRVINTNVKTSVWKLANPVAASGTIWAQYATANAERWAIGVAVQDSAGTETTPIYATGNSTTPSVVSTGNTAGELVLDFLSVLDTGGNTPTITAGAGQTSIKELEGAVAGANGIGGTNEAAATSKETAAGANTTMSWTISVLADWGIHTFQVNPAAAASSGRPSAIKQIYVMP